MIDTAIIKTASTLTCGLYGTPGSLAVDWEHKVDGPICWAVKKVGDLWYLIFRGSVTRDDWLHDFEAVAIWNADLRAHVHPGFNDGVKDILAQAMTIIGSEDFVICGHSLGAARAAIATAYAICNDRKPIARIVWGEPRPGFSDLASILSEVPNYNFENGDQYNYDRVTNVPFTLPFEWYCAGSPHLFVDEPPTDSNPIMIFAWHNFVLYHTAMQKLPDGAM